MTSVATRRRDSKGRFAAGAGAPPRAGRRAEVPVPGSPGTAPGGGSSPSYLSKGWTTVSWSFHMNEFGFTDVIDDPYGISDWDDATDTWAEDVVEAVSPQGLLVSAFGEETAGQVFDATGEAVETGGCALEFVASRPDASADGPGDPARGESSAFPRALHLPRWVVK